ncbi:MAG: hypothetical protein J5854_02550 [Clostridia bacterium]|nr:hypothetical protein [Clostridia bacterium]
MEIAEFLRGDNKDEPLGHVDFNTLIPMPKELNIEAGSSGERGYAAYVSFVHITEGLDPQSIANAEAKCKAKLNDPESWDLGKKYYDNLKKYGAKTWYEWSYDNWGTKWNAYDCDRIDTDRQMLAFFTAWCSVPKIISKISERFPDVTVRYGWADEDIGSNVGRAVFKGGNMIDTYVPADGSIEAYRLSADIYGVSLDELGFVPSKDGSSYEYRMPDGVEEHPIPSGEER